jgi:hypothetical protein
MSPDFITAALPWIAAGFSALQGVAGFSSAKENERRAVAEGKAAVQTGEAEKARQQRINLSKEATFEAEASAQGTTFAGSPMLAYLENVKQGALQAEDFSYKGQLTKYSKKFEARDYNARGWASLLAGGAGVASALAPVFGGGTTKTPPKPTGKLPDIPGPWTYPRTGPLSR